MVFFLRKTFILPNSFEKGQQKRLLFKSNAWSRKRIIQKNTHYYQHDGHVHLTRAHVNARTQLKYCCEIGSVNMFGTWYPMKSRYKISNKRKNLKRNPAGRCSNQYTCIYVCVCAVCETIKKKPFIRTGKKRFVCAPHQALNNWHEHCLARGDKNPKKKRAQGKNPTVLRTMRHFCGKKLFNTICRSKGFNWVGIQLVLNVFRLFLSTHFVPVSEVLDVENNKWKKEITQCRWWRCWLCCVIMFFYLR